jgi:hypothetical protein
MKFLEEALDQYNLRSRFFPAFLMILPLGLGMVAVFPLNYQGPVGIVAGIAAVVLIWYLADSVRKCGQDAQARLFLQWGGKPSVLLLSHFQSVIAVDTLVRCHNKLRELDPNLKIPPSPEEEQSNPTLAMAVYQSCNELLLERTRDKSKLGLLFEENIRYGARRNIYGIRWLGFASAIIGFAMSLGAAIARNCRTGEPDAVSVAGSVAWGLLVIFWLLVVRSRWVRRQANEYGVRLILSCQSLEVKESKPAKEGG